MKKKNLFWILSFLFFFTQCKKANDVVVNEITYEVTLINSTTWHGSYLNENAEVVGISNVPSGWKYIFKDSKQIGVATLNAYSDGVNLNADANMKIYLNGKIVATGKSSSSPTLQYLIP